MRIISGKYKGRKLDGFDILGTRPTMDRVKESLFAMIQLELKDSTCLDLFAGSGALGMEALSNGAKCCYFVDNNSKVIDILNKNIMNMSIDQEYRLIKKDFLHALGDFKDLKFDLIFLDPPYEQNLINKAIEVILKHDLLNMSGLIICEYEKEVINNHNLEIIKDKKYGSKYIKILKKVQ